MGVRVKEKVKGSGEWWIFINHNHVRKAKKIGNDKRLALEVAKKLEARLILGDVNLEQTEIPMVSTFKEYAMRWLDITIPATCKSSTSEDYKGLLKNHILSIFGAFSVNRINKRMVKEFLMKKINEGFASSTVIHMKNVMSGVLNLALDDEVISINPAQRFLKIFRSKNLQLNIDPLSRSELYLLLETVRNHFPRDYPLAITLARTGMRLGEALALKWGDIDFQGRFINLQRGFSRGKIETPKNGKIRRIDMSKKLTEVLKELRHYRNVETIKKGWREVPEWIFITEKGTHLDGENWRNRVFNKALEKANLRKIRIHDLRHYVAFGIGATHSLVY